MHSIDFILDSELRIVLFHSSNMTIEKLSIDIREKRKMEQEMEEHHKLYVVVDVIDL